MWSTVEDVDSTVYHWYSLVRQRLVPVTGTTLQEEALIIMSSLGINDFKASNELAPKIQGMKQQQAAGGEWGIWRCM